MLDAILAATRTRLTPLLPRADEIEAEARHASRPPSLAAALARPGLGVIAEVKRRSPSRGELAADLDPVRQAVSYETGGADAVSVLTEPDFFSGSDRDLTEVAAAVAVPVLRKDFVLDPVQVWEARALGASAVLLIVAALDDDSLSELLATAGKAEIEALVEVHTAVEARRAAALGASLIGVNNRNLDDFTVDLATAETVAGLLEPGSVKVAESGIFTGADAARMAASGYDAVLVGEALIRSADPAALVAELKQPARPARTGAGS